MSAPTIGITYLIFKDGKFLGVGVWADDKWNGLCFLIKQPDGSNWVIWPDGVDYVEKRDK
jgi:hypothetical protein